MGIVDDFRKPRIFCSRCITFEHCRWNGQIISSMVVDRLKPYVEYITTCPEKNIGLGVPRDPIRIVKKNKELKLVQPSTEMDITNKMEEYTEEYLNNISDIDGFILKAKSPTCGISKVKIYSDQHTSSKFYMGKGFFGKKILEKFSGMPIIDEGRLYNQQLREDFFIRTFSFARFQEVLNNYKIEKLIKFHASHKFILMAYNQKELKFLGNLVGKQNQLSEKELLNQYNKHLKKALSEIPRYKSHINVLYHLYGYFKGQINDDEKDFFLKKIAQYKDNIIPLSVCINLLRSWAIRFNEDYLLNQYYLKPFPEELMSPDLHKKNQSRSI